MKRVLRLTNYLFVISLITATLGPTLFFLGTRTTGLQDQKNPIQIVGIISILFCLIVYALVFVIYLLKKTYKKS